MTDHTRIFIERDLAFSDRWQVYANMKNPSRPDKIAVPKEPLVWEMKDIDGLGYFIERGKPGPQHTGISLDDAGCQHLVDGLYQAGFRPQNTVDRKETVEALRQHITSLESQRLFLQAQVERLQAIIATTTTAK